MKAGWKPKRTIIFCAWDAEEPGLIGSTEFAEEHADELKAHAVVYINSDVNARGFFGAEGSHTLEKFINDVARDIQDPETKLSVWKRAQLNDIVNGSPYGLLTSVFTSDLRRGLRFAEEARAGWVNINEGTNYWEPHLPFGGASGSRSGLGRVGGRFTIDRFTQLKTVIVNLA